MVVAETQGPAWEMKYYEYVYPVQYLLVEKSNRDMLPAQKLLVGARLLA